MTQEEFQKCFLERVELLHDELARLKQTLIDVSEGADYDTAWMENVFLEEHQEHKAMESHMARVIEHLLKSKYCTNNYNYKEWLSTILNHRNDVLFICKWNKKNKKSVSEKMLGLLRDSMPDIYDMAVTWYTFDANVYNDLKQGLACIPESCPCTADELLFDQIFEIMNKFPDPEDLTCQFQLYPSCKYSWQNGSTDIAGKLCSTCDNYSQCLSDYYDNKGETNGREKE